MMRQIFIGRGPALDDAPDAAARFERKLYVIRNRAAHEADRLQLRERDLFYVASLSSNTIVYKGMLIADQVERMFPDLADPDVESALALVHSRFSTNTFPSWPLAHPYRYCAHNGEINTLRGNINWMRAREVLCRSDLFGDDLQKLFPLMRRGPERHRDVRQRAGVPRPDRPTARPRRPDDDSGAVEQPRVDEPGAQGVLRVPRLAHGALGRPGVDRLHRRHRHRGGARPQRAAALALLRDEGRHGDHGVRGGRPGHPAGERPRQGAAASRPHLPGRHGTGPDRRRRGDQARSGARAAVRRVAEAGAGPHRRPAAGPARPGRTGGARPHAAARLRLHRGRPADPDRADGAERRRADRLDGHRHGAGGPLGSLAAALRLLQAALRAGDQPAARRDPRGAGHRHGLDARRRGQPAGARRTVVPPRQGRRPGDHERRPGEAAAPGRSGVPLGDAADAFRSARGRGGPREGHGRAVPGGERSGRPRGDAAGAVGPRSRSRVRAGAGPARHRRGPPPPGARRLAHQVRTDRRDRRSPRVPPHGAARGVRRRGHQPVPRVRDHRGAARRRRSAGYRPGRRRSATTSRPARRAC